MYVRWGWDPGGNGPSRAFPCPPSCFVSSFFFRPSALFWTARMFVQSSEPFASWILYWVIRYKNKHCSRQIRALCRQMIFSHLTCKKMAALVRKYSQPSCLLSRARFWLFPVVLIQVPLLAHCPVYRELIFISTYAIWDDMKHKDITVYLWCLF